MTANIRLGNFEYIEKANAVYVGDANFTLTLATNPRITLDSGDYLEWDRSTNKLSLVIGSTGELDYTTGGVLRVLVNGGAANSSSASFSGRATFGYDGTNGMAYVLGGSGKSIELRPNNGGVGTGLRVTTGTVGVLTNGYAYIGSMSSPTNTTAGDLTTNRLSVLGGGTDSAFGSTTGEVIRFTGTLTDTAAGAKVFAAFNPSYSPAANSSSEFRNIFVSNTISPSTGVTMNTLHGFYLENRVRSDAAIAQLAAATLTGVVIDSSSPATGGTIALAYVMDMRGYSRPSGTSTVSITELDGINFGANWIASAGATITTLRGFYYKDPTNSTITNQIAIDIEALSRGGTSNYGIRNAATLKQSGNVGFYGTEPQAKPTVTGSRGANAALASLLTALSGLGLLTDSSTA